MTSKSQLIRDYIAENPNKSPKEVAEALKSRGVTRQYVYTTVYNSRKAGQKKATSRKSTSNAIENLKAAKKFVNACGSMNNAVDTLNTLKNLME